MVVSGASPVYAGIYQFVIVAMILAASGITGLVATLVGSLEDAEDYKAFEAAIIADYEAETAVAYNAVLKAVDGDLAGSLDAIDRIMPTVFQAKQETAT
jgi:hypothetical protein